MLIRRIKLGASESVSLHTNMWMTRVRWAQIMEDNGRVELPGSESNSRSRGCDIGGPVFTFYHGAPFQKRRRNFFTWSRIAYWKRTILIFGKRYEARIGNEEMLRELGSSKYKKQWEGGTASRGMLHISDKYVVDPPTNSRSRRQSVFPSYEN